MSGHKSVFERIEQSPAFADRDSPKRLERLPGYTIGHVLGMMAIPVVVCLLPAGYFIFHGLLQSAKYEGGELISLSGVCFLIFGLAISIVVGIPRWILYKQWSKAPLLTEPAIVVGQETKWAGRSYTNHVMLEFADGRFEEYQLWNRADYSRFGEGKAGVAFIRLNYLLALDVVSQV